MKRVVSSSIITLFIIAAVAITFLYLRNFGASENEPVKAVPADAAFFAVADFTDFTPETLLSPVHRKVFGITPAFKSLEKNIRWLDSLQANNNDFSNFMSGEKVVIAAQVTGAATFDFLYIKGYGKKYSDEIIDGMMTTILEPGQHLAMRNYDGVTIREVTAGNKIVFAYAMTKGLFLASATAFLVEDGIRQSKSGKNVIKDFKALEEEAGSSGMSLFVNFSNLSGFFNVFADPSRQNSLQALDKFGDWLASGVEFEEEHILMNGVLSTADSNSFAACFVNQEPIESALYKILPAKTAFFSLVSMSSPNDYLSKLRNQYFSSSRKEKAKKTITNTSDSYGIRIDEKMREWTGSEFALVITEPSGLNYDNNCFAVISTSDPAKAKKVLNDITRAVSTIDAGKTEEYMSCTMGQIRIPNLMAALYGDAFARISKTHYAIIGSYVVFANQAASLRMFIDDVKSGNLLHKAPSFKSIREQLPVKGNFMYYIKPSSAIYLFRSVANEKWKNNSEKHRDSFTGVKGICFQMNAGPGINRVNAVISYKGGDDAVGASRVFTVDTDSSVMMKPLLTADPKTGNQQILFQDELNNIYLTDNTGNIIWKESVGGKIVGEVFEIDLFKNNLRQFLFNTREHLFLIDDKGKPVGNYPIRLPAAATNGLAVYDFDRKKEPRIYIACENRRVYAYLPSGKPLPGWNLQSMPGQVTRTVNHVKILGKDYLLINDSEGTVLLVTPFGEPGIAVNEKFVLANHSLISSRSSDGALVMSDRSGNIRIILPGGQTETMPLGVAGPEHGFVFEDADGDGNADYIFAEGNELVAYNSFLTMIYRKEFTKKITGDIILFQSATGEKILSVRSIESDQTWMMKTDGTILAGFPVQGGGPALFRSLNQDGKMNLMVGGTANFFRVYAVE